MHAERDTVKRALTRGCNAGAFKFSSHWSIIHVREQGVRPHRKQSGRLVVLPHLPQASVTAIPRAGQLSMLPRSSSCGETPTSVRASAHTTSFLTSDGGSPGTRLRRASTRRVARTFGSASFTGSPSELLDEIGGRGYGHTENRVRLVRMHAQGWASSMLSSSSTMQVKIRALANQACQHPF